MPPTAQSKRVLLLIDLSGVHKDTAKALIVILPVLIGYTMFLVQLWPLSGTLLGAIVLLTFEAMIGLAATRVYNGFGIRARAKVGFTDPSLLIGASKETVLETHLNEIARLFENAQCEAKRFDSIKVDDLTDLAWFAVLVYAIGSVGLIVATGPNFVLCLGAMPLVAVICLICYVDGFRSTQVRALGDDLDELENHIMTRLRVLQVAARDHQEREYVRWLETGKRQVVADIGIVISADKGQCDNGIVVSHWMGIPSKERERIEIVGAKGTRKELTSILGRLSVVAELGWKPEAKESETGVSVRIVNPLSPIRVSSLSSIVADPTGSQKVSETIAGTLTQLLEVLGIGPNCAEHAKQTNTMSSGNDSQDV